MGYDGNGKQGSGVGGKGKRGGYEEWYDEHEYESPIGNGKGMCKGKGKGGEYGSGFFCRDGACSAAIAQTLSYANYQAGKFGRPNIVDFIKQRRSLEFIDRVSGLLEATPAIRLLAVNRTTAVHPY